MWIADHWNDYELIDCGGGQRLERWGKHLLVRPDPQAVWAPCRPDHPGWHTPGGRYVRSSTGGGKWEIRSLPDKWRIQRGPLTFQVKPMNFKHTGVFPEQAANWDFIDRAVRSAGRPVSVLNLFAYTGGATLAAAAAGASVCHVDAAKNMVSWARENAALSGLSDKPVRYIVDDCKKFVQRELRRGRRYDGIVMDPPSYGRGPSGELWKLEDDIYEFVELVAGLLSDKPLFFILNSYTTGLSPAAMAYVVSQAVSVRHGGRVESGELLLPATESGFYLPAGAATRWIAGDGPESNAIEESL